MDAGVLLRDGKVQISQIPTPFPEASGGGGSGAVQALSSPCQAGGKLLWGGGGWCQGSGEGREERHAKAPEARPLCFLFLVMQVPDLGFDC